MAEFLKGNPLFASREILEKEIRRLGLAIPLEPEIRELLRPATIAGRTVGNRFVIHPMEGCDGTLDGKPDEITYHRWGLFARGGAKVLWGEACAVVESVKAASDVYSPLAGEVLAGNTALGDAPEKINSDPYGDGWLFKLKPASAADVDALLDASAYAKFLEESAE